MSTYSEELERFQNMIISAQEEQLLFQDTNLSNAELKKLVAQHVPDSSLYLKKITFRTPSIALEHFFQHNLTMTLRFGYRQSLWRTELRNLQYKQDGFSTLMYKLKSDFIQIVNLIQHENRQTLSADPYLSQNLWKNQENLCDLLSYLLS